MIVNLKCCTCGKTKPVEVSSAPALGVELCQMARAAGWKFVIDLNYSRTLVFCSQECIDVHMTKKGTIRKYLIRKSEPKI